MSDSDSIGNLDESVSSWEASSSNDEMSSSRKAIHSLRHGFRTSSNDRYKRNNRRYRNQKQRNHIPSSYPPFDDNESNGCIVFVTRIPRGVTPKQLIIAFSRCVDIIDADITKNKYSGAHLGFGYLRVKNKEDAKKILDWCFIPRFKDIVTGEMVTLKVKKYSSKLSRYISRLYSLDVIKPSFPNRGEITDLYNKDRNQNTEKGRSRSRRRKYDDSSISSSDSYESSVSDYDSSSSSEEEITLRKKYRSPKREKKIRSNEEKIKKKLNKKNCYYK